MCDCVRAKRKAENCWNSFHLLFCLDGKAVPGEDLFNYLQNMENVDCYHLNGTNEFPWGDVFEDEFRG